MLVMAIHSPLFNSQFSMPRFSPQSYFPSKQWVIQQQSPQSPNYPFLNTISLINMSYHRRQHCHNPHTCCIHHHSNFSQFPITPTFLQQLGPIVLYVTSSAFTPILAHHMYHHLHYHINEPITSAQFVPNSSQSDLL